MELEYPSAGHFASVGTQSTSVLVRPAGAAQDVDAQMARTSIQVGWGGEKLKLGFFVDGLTVGQDVDFFLGGLRSGGSGAPGDYALGANYVVVGSYVHDKFNSILAGFSASSTKIFANAAAMPSEASSVTPLVRLRLCGYTGEIGFPKQDEKYSLGAFLSSINVAGVLSCFGRSQSASTGVIETGSTPLDVLLSIKPRVNYYGAGSNPFILDLANPNVAETHVGLEWASLPDWPVRLTARAQVAVNGDAGFRLAEIGFDYAIKALPFRVLGQLTSPEYFYNMIPVYPFTLLGGIGAPGATFLGVNARAFLVRLDDGTWFGFSAGIRAETFTNNAIRKRDEGSFYDGALRDWEGENHEYLRAYLELRVSQNDMFSTAGLPIEDRVAFGLYYVIELFEHAPVGNDRGRYQANYLNRGLADDPLYSGSARAISPVPAAEEEEPPPAYEPPPEATLDEDDESAR